MAKSPMSPPAIARAAVRSSFDADGDDDGGEEEAFDTDDDPFEDWDDLPSISPAGSPSSEGEGGIASLRSFTDTLRGEMTAEEEAFAAVLSGNEMEPERAFLVAVGPKGGGGGKSKTGEESSAADALAAAVAALSSSSSSSPSSSSLEGEEAEGGEDELDSPPPGSSPPSSAASLSTYTTAESLAELASLAETAGLVVVGRLSQALSAPNPRTYVNAGKVAEIAAVIRGDETGRDIALRMSLGMGDRCADDVVRCTRPDRKNAEQRKAEDRLHIRCGRYDRRAGHAGSGCKEPPTGCNPTRRRTPPR